MGIFLLAANTATNIWPKKNINSWVRISQDITTMTRICKTEDDAANTTVGEILTAYQDKRYFIPAGVDLWAISTGTPNISIHEASEEMDPKRDLGRN